MFVLTLKKYLILAKTVKNPPIFIAGKSLVFLNKSKPIIGAMVKR